MDGLTRLRRPEEVAELRGLTVAEVLGVEKTNGAVHFGRGFGGLGRGSCRGGGGVRGCAGFFAW